MSESEHLAAQAKACLIYATKFHGRQGKDNPGGVRALQIPIAVPKASTP